MLNGMTCTYSSQLSIQLHVLMCCFSDVITQYQFVLQVFENTTICACLIKFASATTPHHAHLPLLTQDRLDSPGYQRLEKMGARVFCFVLLLSVHFCNVELTSAPFTQTSVTLFPCKEYFKNVSLNSNILFAVPPNLTYCVNETDSHNDSVVSWARGTTFHGYSLMVEHAEKISYIFQ